MKFQKYIDPLAVSLGILLIPFIAMQFSDQVNWKIMDFVVAGLLIFITRFSIVYISQHTKSRTLKFVGILGCIIVPILIWIELAVGIFL